MRYLSRSTTSAILLIMFYCFSFKVVKCERFLSETKNNKKQPEKEYAFDYLFDGNELS